jgi:hypothetical protein
MNYENMSDHEINMAVTCIVYNCHDWPVKDNNSGFYHCGVDGSCHYIVNCIDFCNSPNDAWPIIVENRISITTIGNGYWNADLITSIEEWGEDEDFVCSSSGYYQHKNPLRAAMIFFLKMKES